MNEILKRRLTILGTWLILTISSGATAQSPQSGGTLTIAGQPEQAPLIRVRGRSYLDVESLARMLHGSLSFQGSQTVLTLPGTQPGSLPSAPQSSTVKPPPQLSQNYLSAQVQALAQVREWRAALIGAVQNNTPVTDAWVSPLKRSAEAKLQLALAATSTEPDQEAAALLRNEFTAMQQLSDQFVAVHLKANYTSPDSFENNSQDQKIVSCEQSLVSMAASKQFQDVAACH